MTPSADADVDAIADFIQENWFPEVAIRFVNAFFKSPDVLESAPEMETPSRKAMSVRRKMIDKHNALYYELSERALYILCVTDTRSNPADNLH